MKRVDAEPSTAWQLHPLVQLHWRRWGEEWAVFDVGSGQTHQADTLTAVALLTLEASPATVAALLAQIAAELQVGNTPALNAALVDVLERLSAAGLIEPV